MPTMGWILENAEEKFWANQSRISGTIPPLVFPCSICDVEFKSPERLREHFRLKHPLELPKLYIGNEAQLSETVIRTPITSDDIELVQSTRCKVQIDGGPWQPLTLDELRIQLTETRDSSWLLRLINERAIDDSHAAFDCRIRFRIPDIDELNRLDQQFVKLLVKDQIDHSDLDQFEAAMPNEIAAREYGGALGEYALGILLKEGDVIPRSTLSFEEFVTKMRGALNVLSRFDRPVALAVCSIIRFNLNDFNHYGDVPAAEIDTSLCFFRNIRDNNQDSLNIISPHPPTMVRHEICPVDHITGHIFSSCMRLIRNGKLSLTELESLRKLTRGNNPVSEQDHTKIHVLCTYGYFHLGRMTEAREHIRHFQFDYSFKAWATNVLDADGASDD